MVGELGIRFFFIIGIAIGFVDGLLDNEECNFKPPSRPSPSCKSYLRTVLDL